MQSVLNSSLWTLDKTNAYSTVTTSEIDTWIYLSQLSRKTEDFKHERAKWFNKYLIQTWNKTHLWKFTSWDIQDVVSTCLLWLKPNNCYSLDIYSFRQHNTFGCASIVRKLHIHCIQKVSTMLYFFHISSKFYTQHPIMMWNRISFFIYEKN